MMAGTQIPAGDSFASNLAGMSKNQLYEIMSQMKNLIEQNQQQARHILIDNPSLAKALFQAQIMLGMVKPPQVIPNIQPAISQPSKQSRQQLNAPAVQSLQEQASASQIEIPASMQQSSQPALSIPSASRHTIATLSPQSLQQAKGYPSGQMTSTLLPQSSQIHNMPPGQLHSASQPVPTVSSQPQQSLHSSGFPHLPLQPLLPSQPRPPSMHPFQHQVHSQIGSHLGFQPPDLSQPHISQPPFSSQNKPLGSIGSSFPLRHSPLPSQPPPHSLYEVKGGSHLGADFSGQGRAGTSMQVDRPSWIPPGLQENQTAGLQLPNPQMSAGQMGIGSQSHSPLLTTDMEKALLLQVMSLTPEQINLLPPEQRHQVLQLQQMLR